MKQLASEAEITTAIANLKLKDNGFNTFEISSLEKFLANNKPTASKKFNAYLLEVIADNQQPPNPDELIDELTEKNLKVERILDAVCHNPISDFNYKGVNLLTSINYKLAPRLNKHFI